MRETGINYGAEWVLARRVGRATYFLAPPWHNSAWFSDLRARGGSWEERHERENKLPLLGSAALSLATSLSGISRALSRERFAFTPTRVAHLGQVTLFYFPTPFPLSRFVLSGFRVRNSG